MVRITDRDVRLLVKCAAARWLTTGQIRRMFFPESTLDAVRKRLRKLADEGFLLSSQPHRMTEMLHGVGREGSALLATKGLEIKVSRKMPDHLEHSVGINDIRIAVEAGSWHVEYFFAHWELAQFGWHHSVIPDAVFSVHADSRLTFMAEYDRGTEGREVLRGKLRQYGGLSSFRFHGVILVAESEHLCQRLSRSLSGAWRYALGFCCLPDIQTSGVGARIFMQPRGSGKVALAELATFSAEE